MVEEAAEMTSCFALHSKHSTVDFPFPAQKPSSFCSTEGACSSGLAIGCASRGGRSFISTGLGAEGEKLPPQWRHIVLFAAAYSICLKPQCGHSTLSLAGPGFATGREGEG